MKKSTLAMLCLLMILSAVFCLAGCKSREQRLSEESTYEDAHMKSMGKKVINCIKTGDKEGLKKLFSKSAQKDIEDLDGKIDEMLEAFKGESIVSVKSEPVDSSRTNDYGKESISIYGEQAFKLKDGKSYAVWIDFCDKDDNNKDNVGLYMIEVCTCSREELPEEFTWEGVNSGNPGIFIHYID